MRTKYFKKVESSEWIQAGRDGGRWGKEEESRFQF